MLPLGSRLRQSKCWKNFVNIWRVPSTATTRSYDLIRSNCAELVGQLFLTHQRLVADWIPFDRTLNNHVDLDALLGGGYGKLADGPEFLVAAYAAILERHGVSPSLLPARPSKWFDGRAWGASKKSEKKGIDRGGEYDKCDFQVQIPPAVMSWLPSTASWLPSTALWWPST